MSEREEDLWTLEISLVPPPHLRFEHRPYRRAVKLPSDTIYIGRRVVDEIKTPELSRISMDQTVKIMKIREFRRKQFLEYAHNMGGQLADLMEDHEGWHGLDRQESAEKWLATDTGMSAQPTQDDG